MAGVEYFLVVDVEEQKVYTNLTVRHYYNGIIINVIKKDTKYVYTIDIESLYIPENRWIKMINVNTKFLNYPFVINFLKDFLINFEGVSKIVYDKPSSKSIIIVPETEIDEVRVSVENIFENVHCNEHIIFSAGVYNEIQKNRLNPMIRTNPNVHSKIKSALSIFL